MEGLRQSYDMACSLIRKLDNSSRNREITKQLSERVSVLLPPLRVLLPAVIGEKDLGPVIYRLRRILQEADGFGDKLLERSEFFSFWHSSGDREKLRDIETRLDSSVNDLNLLVSLVSLNRINRLEDRLGERQGGRLEERLERLEEKQSTLSRQCSMTQPTSIAIRCVKPNGSSFQVNASPDESVATFIRKMLPSLPDEYQNTDQIMIYANKKTLMHGTLRENRVCEETLIVVQRRYY
mmetsp:Transcript_3500/g.7269  ORF Transcript_3500/g.7269 Transcript_3500/m.7269 type:complete len:238 (-) Transcript_3500:461-1174(-)